MSDAFTKTENCFACYTFKLSLEDSTINILSRKQNNIFNRDSLKLDIYYFDSLYVLIRWNLGKWSTFYRVLKRESSLRSWEDHQELCDIVCNILYLEQFSKK